VGTGASLPLGEDGGAAFWDKIFKDAADWGLTTFKLDHAQSNIPNLAQAQTDLLAADTWLTTMTNAAAKHGISKQYGGCVSSMFLHSVTLPSAASARVGPDYIPSARRPEGTCAALADGGGGELGAGVGSGEGRGSADRGVKGVFSPPPPPPPEHLLTSFHTVEVGGIWRSPTFSTIVMTPLAP
jgi:hypothetical protein